MEEDKVWESREGLHGMESSGKEEDNERKGRETGERIDRGQQGRRKGEEKREHDEDMREIQKDEEEKGR